MDNAYNTIKYEPRSIRFLNTKLPVIRVIDLFELHPDDDPLYVLLGLYLAIPNVVYNTNDITYKLFDDYDSCLSFCIEKNISTNSKRSLEQHLSIIKDFFIVCDRLELLVTHYSKLIELDRKT